MDKLMIVLDMTYVIVNEYNVILVCWSLVQNITIFPICSAQSSDIRQHRMINIEHVYDSHLYRYEK